MKKNTKNPSSNGTKAVLARLQAVGITDDKTQQELIRKGITSAHQIAGMGSAQVHGLLGPELGPVVFKKAQSVVSASAALRTTLSQHSSPHYRAIKGSSLAASTEATFAENPSYAELFGGIDFAEIPDARDIYSASAYLIDLFRLMEATVDQGSVADYQFENRRPDIYDLELDEANTNDLIPKLEIVNTVLQNRLLAMSDETGYSSDNSLTSLDYPMNLPANINLEQLRKTIGLLNTTVAELWQTTLGPLADRDTGNGSVNDDLLAIDRETAGISASMYELLISDTNGNAEVQRLYGQAVDQDYEGQDATVQSALLTSLTDIDMNRLARIVYGDTSLEEQNAGVTDRFYVNIQIPDSFNPQDDPMQLVSLEGPNDGVGFINPVRLCEVNRLIRIANLTGFDVVDTDWILAATYYDFMAEFYPYSIVKDSIPFFAFCKKWTANYNLSVNQAIAAIGPMKNYGQADGEDFMQSIYGSLAAGDTTWNYTQPQSDTWGLLKQALNFNDDDMTVLGATYSEWFAAGENTIDLNYTVLCSMYRASLLCQIFRISLSELLLLLSSYSISNNKSGELILRIGSRTYYDVVNLLYLLEGYVSWYKSNQLDYATLRYILLSDGTSDVAGIANPPVDVVRQVVTQEEAQAFQEALTANEEESEVEGARVASFASLPTLNTGFSVKDEHGTNYSMEPMVNATRFAADLQAVGYIDADGIEQETAQLNAKGHYKKDLPELQEYVNTTLLGNDESHHLTKLIKQLGGVITTSALQTRFLAYFTVVKAAGKKTSPFAAALMELLTDNKKISTEMLATLPLSEVNLNLSNKAGGEVPSVVTADFLFEDLMLSGYINKHGKVIAQANAHLSAMQAYMADELDLNDPTLTRLINKVKAVVLDSAQVATDTRFLTYLNHIDDEQEVFATNLSTFLSAASENQEAAFNHTLGDFLGITDNAVMEGNLYAWAQTLLGQEPIAYYMEQDPTSATYITNLDNLRRLATNFTRTSLNDHVTGWWVDTTTDWFDLHTLTLASDQQLIANQYEDDEGQLVVALNATSLNAAATELNAITGWAVTDIENLMNLWYTTTPDGISMTDLEYLEQCFQAADATSLSIDTLMALAAARNYNSYDEFTTLGTSLTAALKATYHTDAAWQEVYQPVQVAVDEYRRDAYASLLLYGCSKSTTLQDITTYRELSEYLCTDIQVTGLVETSKTAEAMRAVQFYLYRAAMGLEPNVTFTDEEQFRTQWEWMRSYRVWEANRKIFVNAENYVTPDLLPNPTDAYSDLKSTLQGNQIDDALIAEAYGTYLDDFMKVANLTTVASFLGEMATDAEGNDYQYLYLIGRTRQEPYGYYWRKARFVHSANDQVLVEWEPWVETGLKLPHVDTVSIAFAYDRLFMFWAEYTNGPRDEETDTQRVKGTLRYSCFQLAAGQWGHPQAATAQTLVSVGITSVEQAKKDFGKVNLEVKQVDGEALLYFDNIVGNGFLDRHQQVKSSLISFPNPVLPNNLQKFQGEWSSEGFFGLSSYDGFEVVPDGVGGSALWWTLLSPMLFSHGAESYEIADYSFFSRFKYQSSVPFDIRLIGSIDNDSTLIEIHRAPGNTLLQVFLRHVKNGQLVASRLIATVQMGNVWFDMSINVTFDGVQFDPDSTARIEVHIGTDNEPDLYQNVITVPADNAYLLHNADFVEIGPSGILPGVDFRLESAYVFPGYVSHEQLKARINAPSAAGSLLPPLVSILNDTEAEALEGTWEKNNAWRDGKEESPGGQIPEVIVTRGAEPQLSLLSGQEWFLTEGAFSTWFKPAFGDRQSSPGTLLHWHADDSRTGIPNWLETNLVIDPDSLELKLIVTGADADGNEKTYLSKDMEVLPEGEWYLINFAQKHNTRENDGSVYHFEVEVRDSSLTTLVAEQFSFEDVENHFTFCSQVPAGGLGFFAMGGAFSNFAFYPQSGYEHVARGSGHHEQRVAARQTPESLFGNLPVGASYDQVLVHDQGTTPWYVLKAQNSEFLLAAHYLTGSNDDTYSCIRLDSPAVSELSSIFLSDSTDGLLSIEAQNTEESDFDDLSPTSLLTVVPTNTIDLASANGIYFWELWFFSPWLIAKLLADGQDYEAAKVWFEYIYNPTQKLSESATYGDEYWNFRGLQASENAILLVEHQRTANEELQSELGGTPVPSNLNADALELAEALNTYLDDPFDADGIANLRPIAYQKAIVMAYVDNLLNWGDLLFTQNTRESINEASLVYMTALDLLGRKPVDTGESPLPAVQTVQQILDDYSAGDIPPFLIGLEDTLAQSGVSALLKAAASTTPSNYIADAYFGVPENDRFSNLWDTLQQRLYNIRHSLNINGDPNYLPLFAPELNPADINALVGGSGAGSGYNTTATAVPPYRYEVMLDKAKGFTQTVMNLEQSLLSALEKKDAEHLANLMVNQQLVIQDMSVQLREDAVESAQYNIEALNEALGNATYRQQHYQGLISGGLNALEKAELGLNIASSALFTVANGFKMSSILPDMVPNIFGLSNGGAEPAKLPEKVGGMYESAGWQVNNLVGTLATQAGYQRRAEDWTLQAEMANYDIAQINDQLEEANLTLAQAEQDLAILNTEISQQEAIQQYYQSKFTNEDLYGWMAGQLSSLCYQAFQMAVDMSYGAKKAMEYQLGLPVNLPIANTWNGHKKGLLAGEALMNSLNQFDQYYTTTNVRRKELTKTISLKELSSGPAGSVNEGQLQQLILNGSCNFQLNEKLFDLDYPGHYCRQIKSMTVTIPALLGPYQNVHATLRQSIDRVLMEPNFEAVQALLGTNGDIGDFSDIIRTNYNPNQAICLSNAVNDAGVFVLNFDDPRYLPFEGTGAISEWEFSIPKEKNLALLVLQPDVSLNDDDPVNVDTQTMLNLSDVIIEVHYTALVEEGSFQSSVWNEVEPANGFVWFDNSVVNPEQTNTNGSTAQAETRSTTTSVRQARRVAAQRRSS